MRRDVLLTAIFILGILTGCGRKAEEKVLEQTIEKQTGGKATVDLSEEKMSIETEDGSIEITGGKSAKLPDDFPADIYVLDRAKVISVMTLPGGSSVTFTASEEPSAVADLYKKEMTAKGWAVMRSMNMDPQQIIMFSKDKRTVTASIAMQDDQTMVALVLAQQ